MGNIAKLALKKKLMIARIMALQMHKPYLFELAVFNLLKFMHTCTCR